MSHPALASVSEDLARIAAPLPLARELLAKLAESDPATADVAAGAARAIRAAETALIEARAVLAMDGRRAA